MSNTIKIRRGLHSAIPVLVEAEHGFSTDTKQVNIGDGTTNYEFLMHHQFGANTVMVADADDTPTAKVIAAQSVVGRITGGVIEGINIGISDNNIVQVSGTPSIEGFAQFDNTGDGGLKGLTGAQSMAALSGKATAAFSFNGQEINLVATPVLGTDGVNKDYVDLMVAGVKDASSADVYAQLADGNITLSGLQTIDGVVLTDGETVVIAEHQTLGTETGIWVVHSGAWTRAEGWEVGEEVGAYFVFIKGGTYDGNGYIVTNDDLSDIVGTDTIVFSQFSQAGGGANKQLSNLEDTVAINKSLISGIAGLDLGSTAFPWQDLYLKSAGEIKFGTSISLLHSPVSEFGGDAIILSAGDDFVMTGKLGRSTSDYIGWDTDNQLDVMINSDLHSIVSITDGAADNDKLVTQGYVDDQVAAYNTFLELDDTPVAYGSAYDFVKMNAAGNALEYVAIIDGGTF